jgi:hypothetical protein
MKSKYIWTNESTYKFQLAMDSVDIKTKFDVYNHMTIDGTKIYVDGGAAELTDLILTAADASLKQTPKYNSNQTKHKAWFNLDLHKMRINLINYGKIYSKHPNDLSVKSQYYKLYREYRKSRKLSYRQHKQKILKYIKLSNDLG